MEAVNSDGKNPTLSYNPGPYMLGAFPLGKSPQNMKLRPFPVMALQ